MLLWNYLLSLTTLLLVWGFVSEVGGSSGACLERSVVSYSKNDDTGGSLSLACTGTHYIVTFISDNDIISLSLYAECSSPCEENKTYYYFDTTGLNRIEITDLNGTLNGSEKLNMPSPQKSNCSVFGHYHTLKSVYKFTNASCLVEAPQLTENLTTEASLSPESDFSTKTTVSNESGPKSTSPARRSANSYFVIVGTPTFVVLPVLIIIVISLLLLGLCYHHYCRTKSNHVQRNYIEKISDNERSSDNFKVYNDSNRNLCSLTPSLSQVSVFDSFSKFTINSEKTWFLKTDLENTFSGNSLKVEESIYEEELVEIGGIKKRNLSDSSRTGGEAELMEEMAQVEDMAEIDTEPSCTPNSPSPPRTPSCNSSTESRSMMDHNLATTNIHMLQDTEEKFQSGYIYSNNHGNIEPAITEQMSHVISTGYISNSTDIVGSNNTNELQSALLAHLNHSEITSTNVHCPLGSDYISNNTTGNLSESTAKISNSMPSIFQQSDFEITNTSDGTIQVTSTQQDILEEGKLFLESFSSNASGYLSDLSQHTSPRTPFNPHCTPDHTHTESRNTTTSPACTEVPSQLTYVQDEPLSNSEIVEISTIQSSSSNSHKNFQTLQHYRIPNDDDHNLELNVGLVTFFPILKSAEQNVNGYISCSNLERSSCTNNSNNDMLTLHSSMYPLEGSAGTEFKPHVLDSRHTSPSSDYISSNKEYFSLVNK